MPDKHDSKTAESEPCKLSTCRIMKAFKHLIAESECTRFMLDVADGSARAPGMVLAAGELETEPGELAPRGVVDRSSLATRVSL